MNEASALAFADNREGKVTAVNKTGVQLFGIASWFNVSKYNPVPLTLPMVGDDVTLHLDKQGYIRAISTKRQVSGAATAHQAVRTAVQQAAHSDHVFRLKCLDTVIAMFAGGEGQLPTLEAHLATADIIESWARKVH